MCHTGECLYEHHETRECVLPYCAMHDCLPDTAACEIKKADMKWTKNYLIWEQKNRKEIHK